MCFPIPVTGQPLRGISSPESESFSSSIFISLRSFDSSFGEEKPKGHLEFLGIFLGWEKKGEDDV